MDAQTFFSLATPPGEGGIHVLRIAGPGTRSVLTTVFRPAGKKTRTFGGSLVLGHVVDGDEPLDEVLLARLPADNEQGELFELHLHGGPAPVTSVSGLLESLGARPITPERFERRGSHPSAPPATWRARALLCRARTRFASGILAAQADGALARSTRKLARALLDAAEGGGGGEAGVLAGALADSIPLGEALVRPPLVQIMGPPNAGKSTLFNALLGRDRAIVDEAPGTTRDRVREEADFSGVPVLLSDSAGLAEVPGSPVEESGIVETRRGAGEAALCLFLFDGARPPGEEALREWGGVPEPRLAFVGKSDLPGAASVLECAEDRLGIRIGFVSGSREDGLGSLRTVVLDALRIRLPSADGGNEPVLPGGRLSRLVVEAGFALGRGDDKACRRIGRALERYGTRKARGSQLSGGSPAS